MLEHVRFPIHIDSTGMPMWTTHIPLRTMDGILIRTMRDEIKRFIFSPNRKMSMISALLLGSHFYWKWIPSSLSWVMDKFSARIALTIDFIVSHLPKDKNSNPPPHQSILSCLLNLSRWCWLSWLSQQID